MRILFVSFHHPWPHDTGARQRRFYLAREFASRHEVHLVSLLPQEDGDRAEWTSYAKNHFASMTEYDCREWSPAKRPRSRWVSIAQNLPSLLLRSEPRFIQKWQVPRALEFFDRLRREIPHDAAWIDRSFIGMVARNVGMKRFAVDVDDLHTIIRQREYEFDATLPKRLERLESWKIRRFEHSMPDRFWRVVVCKEADRDFFPNRRDNVFVVPNGVEERPALPPDMASPGHLLFVGAMYYEPNQDAVKWFVKEIFPLVKTAVPGSTFHIVGQHPPPAVTALADPGSVFVHGSVASVEPYYTSASVVVAPIRLGSGTRLKVLEALGYGKPLVATSTASEGLGLTPDRHYRLADSKEGFADACIDLLKSSTVCRSLGEQGRLAVLDRFRWNSIAKRAEAVFES